MPQLIRVALDVPLHRFFDYTCEGATPEDIGRRIRVPFGNRELIGILVELPIWTDQAPENIRQAIAILHDLPPLPLEYITLCRFVSEYYETPPGPALLQPLPTAFKQLAPPKRRTSSPKEPAKRQAGEQSRVTLNSEQKLVCEHLLAQTGYAPCLLHGITGSGKTEVYLQLIEAFLERNQQILVLIPEINLTPQLEARIRERFPSETPSVLHSELTEARRERHWRNAFEGSARIVLGTRLAVFTPMPDLGLIIVDEEHDQAFKQQENPLYSARDLAVFRAHARRIPILLGSATPSLESWLNAEQGRYHRLKIQQRANPKALLPKITLLDTRLHPLNEGGLSAELLGAIETRQARQEQSLLFLNRRGYAPVLTCIACGWISGCKRCASHLVLHLLDGLLCCHHCGFQQRLPDSCPSCGNQDMQPIGRGTQRVEAWFQRHSPDLRILRVDRDSARNKKHWEALLAQITDPNINTRANLLIGTQMLAKGHDFPDITLVGVLSPDSALFSADYRASERLFSQLMQVAGRAGRASRPGEVLIQTRFPEHPLYEALVKHDYPSFAKLMLSERRAAGLPPFTYQAILRADSPEMAGSLAFLKEAANLAISQLGVPDKNPIRLYDPVPMRLSRLANFERAQLLVESSSRPSLHTFLSIWREKLVSLKTPKKLRWRLDIDPVEY